MFGELFNYIFIIIILEHGFKVHIYLKQIHVSLDVRFQNHAPVN
jgi:hypothetical protein